MFIFILTQFLQQRLLHQQEGKNKKKNSMTQIYGWLSYEAAILYYGPRSLYYWFTWLTING